MPRIQLPHNGWTERPYQERLWDHLCGGGKRAIAVWHRRAGKDDIALHYAAIAMHTRVGNCWHCLPEYAQGRKALWTAVNPHTGRRRIDEAFPPEIREATNDSEMFIRFRNGSTWQIIGSDCYDKTVGSSPMGITYSVNLHWPTLPPGPITDQCYKKIMDGLYSLRRQEEETTRKRCLTTRSRIRAGSPSSSPSTTRAR